MTNVYIVHFKDQLDNKVQPVNQVLAALKETLEDKG